MRASMMKGNRAPKAPAEIPLGAAQRVGLLFTSSAYFHWDCKCQAHDCHGAVNISLLPLSGTGYFGDAAGIVGELIMGVMQAHDHEYRLIYEDKDLYHV